MCPTILIQIPTHASMANRTRSRMDHNVQKYAHDFSRDPVALLHGWGCLVRVARQIEVVYRIQEFGRDSADSWERVSVFGYPIWIIAK